MRLVLTIVAAVVAGTAAAAFLTGGSDRSQARPAAERARLATRPLSIRPAGRPVTRAHARRQTHPRRVANPVQDHTVVLRPAQVLPPVEPAPVPPAPHPEQAVVRHAPAPRHHTPAPAPRRRPAKRPVAPPARAPQSDDAQGQQSDDGGGPGIGIGIEVHGDGLPEVAVHGNGNGNGNGHGGDGGGHGGGG